MGLCFGIERRRRVGLGCNLRDIERLRWRWLRVVWHVRSSVEGRPLCIRWDVSIDNITLNFTFCVRDERRPVGSNFVHSVRKQIVRRT